MGHSTLEQMFRPTSVVVIGASEEPDTPARDCMQNLLGGTFLGPVIPVVTGDDAPETVFDQPVHTAIDTLPITPDLAIICADADDVPYYIEELGKRGTQHAILFSSGFSRLRPAVQKNGVLPWSNWQQRTGYGCLAPIVSDLSILPSV